MVQDSTEKICPYCQFHIKPGAPVVVCSDCHIPHHPECWEENGGCTTFGCQGAALTGEQAEAAAIGHAGRIDLSMKRCPMCGEEIRAEAIKCRYCKSVIGSPQEVREVMERLQTSGSGSASPPDQDRDAASPASHSQLAANESGGAGSIPSANARRLDPEAFNWWAFFFGWLWYLVSGMWQKAFSLFGVGFLVNLFLGGMFGDGVTGWLIGILIMSLYTGSRANADYLRFQTRKEQFWW